MKRYTEQQGMYRTDADSDGIRVSDESSEFLFTSVEEAIGVAQLIARAAQWHRTHLPEPQGSQTEPAND